MASRFWVGGTGTWDASTTTPWATTSGGAGGASVPTSSDDVTFDASSGGGTVSISININVNSLTMGAFTGTLDFGSNNPTMGAFLGNGTGTRSIINPGTTWTLTGTGTVWNTSTVTNLTATWPATIDHNNSSATACTWILGTTLTSTTFKRSAGSGSLTITATGQCGSIDLTGYTGTTVTGTINLLGNWTGVSSLTSSSTLTINFTATSGTQTITMGSTATAISIKDSGTGGTLQLQDNFTSTGSITLAAGTFDANSKSITCGSFSSTGVGAGAWLNAPASLAITGSGSSVLIFSGTNAMTGTWPILDHNNSSATNCTWTGVSTNAPIVTCKRSAGSGNLTFTTFYCNSIDISGMSATQFSGSAFLTGNWVGCAFASSLSNATLNFIASSGTQTIKMNTTGTTVNVVVNCPGATLQLLDNLTGTSITFTKGTLDLNAHNLAALTTYNGTSGTAVLKSSGGNFNHSLTINGVGGTLQLNGSLIISSTRAITLTNGTFDYNSNSVTMGLFSSSNSNTRSIVNTGSGAVNWTLTGSGTVWDTSTSTGLTAAFPAIVNHTNASANACTWSLGNQTLLNSTTFKRSAGSGTLTITATGQCKAIDLTGYTGTQVTGTVNLLGNWTGTSTLTSSSTPTLNFIGTSGTALLTLGSSSVAATVTLNGAGSTLQLQDTMGAGSITLTAGTLDINSQSVTISSFSSNNSNVRSVINPGSLWTITGNGLFWNTGTLTNLTATWPTTIRFTNTSFNNQTFAGGGGTFNNLRFSGTGSSSYIIQGSNTFNTLTVDTGPNTLTFTAGTTQTISHWSVSGSAGNLVTINSSSPGTPAIIQGTTSPFTSDYVALNDNHITGVNAYAGNHSTISTGNTGWVVGPSQAAAVMIGGF